MNNYNDNFKICTNCGTQLPTGAAFCPYCGQRNEFANDQNTNPYSIPNSQNPYYINTPANNYVDRKTFIEKFAHPSIKKEIMTIAIVCYVIAGINVFLGIVLPSLYLASIIDGLVLLGVALGMHISKSRGCAIALFVLSIIEVLLSLIVGMFPWLWLVAGISSLVVFNKVEKQYKDFTRNRNNMFYQ